MSKYEVNTILSMWAQDKLTVEQAVGQILQHLQALLGRLGQVEKQVEQLRRQEERGVVVPIVAKPDAIQEVTAKPQIEEAEWAEVVSEAVVLETEVEEEGLLLVETSEVDLRHFDEEKETEISQAELHNREEAVEREDPLHDDGLTGEVDGGEKGD